MISIQIEQSLPLEEFVFILNDSGLGVRRPMHDPELLQRMILGSNLLVSARINGEIVGLLRGITDHCYRCFIADLAVAKNHQKKGIGSQLLGFVNSMAPEARMFLFSAEDAEPFYQKLGFQLHEKCYQLKP
jgi:GNAT superfamily N-acetyltransferase